MRISNKEIGIMTETFLVNHPPTAVHYKQLRCPKCGQRMIDGNSNDNYQIWDLKDPKYHDLLPELRGKCQRCKSEIGFKKL